MLGDPTSSESNVVGTLDIVQEAQLRVDEEVAELLSQVFVQDTKHGSVNEPHSKAE